MIIILPMKLPIASLYSVSALALSLMIAAPAHAQLEEAAREAERLNREQQIRQDVQRLRDEATSKKHTTIEVAPPAAPKGSGSGCRDIKDIRLEGATLIPGPKQEKMVASFEGKCLGVNEIQQLMADITGYYIKKGYAASRAYIPEQDLTTGILKILVVEGTVKKVMLEDGGKNSINMDGAFPYIEGRVLDLRQFEMGLDQVNRLTSNNASLDIRPGDLPGESVVVIKNEPKFPIGASFSADSYGAHSTGRYQTSATVMAMNLAGLNELFSYTRRQSVPFYNNNRNSDSDSLFLSIPHGSTTFSFGYSDSAYASELKTVVGNILALEGDSRNTYAKIDQNIWRSQLSKWNLSAMITNKVSNNFVGGQKLGVSSRSLTVLDLDTDLSTQALGGSVGVSGGVAFGMPLFGALEDASHIPSDIPHAQFTKLKLGANYSLPFEVLARQATFSTVFTGQYSFQSLYGSEQISVGGPYSVRGFYDSSLANDHGYYLRNDLSFIQPITTIGSTPLALKPYIGLDVGSVAGVAEKTPNGTMVGGAVGFSILGGPASFDIFTSRPILEPDAVEREGWTTFARASVSF